jgi:hypothetical protein
MRFFDSPTSRRFANVSENIFKPGPVRDRFDPTDVFDIVWRADSPKDLGNFFRLVGPKQFRKTLGRHLNDMLEESVEVLDNGMLRIDGGKIRQLMGLTGGGERTKTLRAALGLAGSDVTPKMLNEFVDVVEAATKNGIPDVSSFIARRAVLGGSRGVLTAAMPLASRGTGGEGIIGTVNQAVGSLAVILGTRKLARFLSDPAGLRWLTQSLDPGLEAGVRKSALDNVFRILQNELESDPEKTQLGDVQQALSEFKAEGREPQPVRLDDLLVPTR